MGFRDELRRQRERALNDLATARGRGDDFEVDVAHVRLADLENLAERNGVRF